MFTTEREMTVMHPDAARRGARLDTLTDGVMAIVITLLVLDLRLPERIAIMNSAEVWGALQGMRAQLTSYLFSFVVAGLLWLNHVQLSRRASTAGVMRVWLSFAFLASVALIPFATALLSRNGSAAATIVYAGVMAFASFILGVMGFLAEAGVPDRAAVRRLEAHFTVPAIFLISIAVAGWSVHAARAAWLLVAVTPLIHRRRMLGQPSC